MKKYISNKSFIRNLVKRVLISNEDYEKALEKIRSYESEVNRIKDWNFSSNDEVILSKLHHYLKLTNELLKHIKKLPVVKHIEPLSQNREYAENMVKHLACYPQKGKRLQHTFVQIIFAHEKWLNNEINARNI